MLEIHDLVTSLDGHVSSRPDLISWLEEDRKDLFAKGSMEEIRSTGARSLKKIKVESFPDEAPVIKEEYEALPERCQENISFPSEAGEEDCCVRGWPGSEAVPKETADLDRAPLTPEELLRVWDQEQAQPLQTTEQIVQQWEETSTRALAQPMGRDQNMETEEELRLGEPAGASDTTSVEAHLLSRTSDHGFPEGMSLLSSGRKGRGVSWRHQEILDLLDIWGEPKIQEQLRASHRNIEAFEIIARKMACRGHRRNAVECRSKTKCMRLEYQRVVNHNSRTGKHTATCPYYTKLHSILHNGDAAVRPKRIPRNIKKKTRASTPLAKETAAPARTEEHCAQDAQAGNAEEYMVKQVLVPGDGHSEEKAIEESIETCIVGDRSDAASSGIGVEMEADQADTEVDKEQDAAAPNRPAPALSPDTCMAILRTKKKRKGESDMIERLMKHSSMENARLLSAMEKDSKVFSEYVQLMKEEDAQIKEERKAFLSSIDNLGTILQSLVSGLNKIGEALLRPDQSPAAGFADSFSSLNSPSGCVSPVLCNGESTPSQSTHFPGSLERASPETSSPAKESMYIPDCQG